MFNGKPVPIDKKTDNSRMNHLTFRETDSFTCKSFDSSPKKDTHDLHPVNWKSENINTSKPAGHEQLEYWQFRINKGNGRVIGVKIDNKFYIVWLDPYHNLTNSDGYGKAKYYYRPKTEYELLQERYEHLKNEYAELSEENKTFKEIFAEM